MFAAALGPILLPEIIILVAEFLGDDVQSISNLYKVNKAACRTLRSHLYRSVHLRSVRNATLFFQVSTISRVDELRNIRSLQLGFDRSNLMPAFEMQSDLVPAFRSALDMMHHISSLSLSTTPSVLDDLLEGFDPPFQLTEFIHSGELSLTLAKFLEKQPSIVKLGWHSLFLGEKLEYLSKLLSDTRTFLPALRELAGPMLLLSALIPRRPIIRVQVMYNSLSFVLSESMMATFLHPMGRLSSLCIMEYRPTWQSFTAFISKLDGTCVPNTLNEVHVVEAFTVCSLRTNEFKISQDIVGL
ncbi:unnamed protein product [Rhizoctonia solani]|uniref:F-box domain-containing protein n=1 Tax=Rhizoctonia solani TaxID=456999 RepID=A0A8H3E116_9AGAM|nr:unnamed protein product [Rhizoctonia solani]